MKRNYPSLGLRAGDSIAGVDACMDAINAKNMQE